MSDKKKKPPEISDQMIGTSGQGICFTLTEEFLARTPPLAGPKSRSSFRPGRRHGQDSLPEEEG